MKRQYKYTQEVSKELYKRLVYERKLPNKINQLDHHFHEENNTSLRFLEDLENDTIATLRYDSSDYATIFVEDNKNEDSNLLKTALKIKLFGIENLEPRAA